jgi:hypothetical protein
MKRPAAGRSESRLLSHPTARIEAKSEDLRMRLRRDFGRAPWRRRQLRGAAPFHLAVDVFPQFDVFEAAALARHEHSLAKTAS